MKKIKIGLIGAGNIMQTRHIPALRANSDKFYLSGILSLNKEKLKKVAQKYNIPNYSGYTRYDELKSIPWLQEVDAVIIAIPPQEHYTMVKLCLNLGKHVLVEKPFVTDIKQGEELVFIAKEKHLILAVNHNFQFSNSFMKMYKLVESGKVGNIKSFYSIQVSNEKRRLPIWAEDLPLGLFYDESPHVFYLLRRFSKGDLTVKNVYRVNSENKKNTPKILNIDISANNIPASIYINFDSPLCEWYFTVFGEKKVINIDMFRDIITILPSDGQHLMKEVFRTSLLASIYHWKGFVINGVGYIRHKLHYGMNITHYKFYDAIINSDYKVLENMSGEDGLKINKTQYEVQNFRLNKS